MPGANSAGSWVKGSVSHAGCSGFLLPIVVLKLCKPSLTQSAAEIANSSVEQPILLRLGSRTELLRDLAVSKEEKDGHWNFKLTNFQ